MRRNVSASRSPKACSSANHTTPCAGSKQSGAAGFRVYLDDFGTGYSSLSYLKRFRVDTVKIDKAFIRDMSQVASDRVMIEAVIMMADALQLSVVAEGIETPEQRDLLRSLGCTYGQGYLLLAAAADRAVPAAGGQHRRAGHPSGLSPPPGRNRPAGKNT